jgi:hypothetical protein
MVVAVTLQLATSFLNHINEYINFVKLLSEPEFSEFTGFSEFFLMWGKAL